jgi:hypothetical protein
VKLALPHLETDVVHSGHRLTLGRERFGNVLERDHAATTNPGEGIQRAMPALAGATSAACGSVAYTMCVETSIVALFRLRLATVQLTLFWPPGSAPDISFRRSELRCVLPILDLERGIGAEEGMPGHVG